MCANFQNRIGQLNYLLFLLLLMVLPYHWRLIQYVWIAWMISWVLEGRWLHKPVLDADRKKGLVLYIGLVVWLLWEMLSSLWSLSPASTWAQVGRHINLAVMIIPALWGVNQHYNKTTILRTLVLSGIASVVVYMMLRLWIPNYAIAINKWETFNYDVIDPWGFHFYRNIDWLHMDDLLFTIKHRLYYTVFLAMSIAAAWYLRHEWAQRYGKALAGVFVALTTIVLSVTVYWTGSRAGLINLIVLAALALITAVKGWRRWVVAGSTIVVTAAVLVGLIHFHPRFQLLQHDNLLSLFSFDAQDVTNTAADPRIAIWHTALESPKDYLCHGIGAGCTAEYLTHHYEQYGWTEYVQHRYNSHNQVLCEAIELGGLAALLFLALWCAFPWTQKKSARRGALYVSTILVLSMMTENFLSGIEGIVTVCVALLLVQINVSSPVLPSATATCHEAH